jgi:glycosyltransferase involved in cell wall biosynthesis
MAMSSKNVLVIASCYPMPDRASGDFRFTQLLRMLAVENSVYFLPMATEWQLNNEGSEAVEHYRSLLSDINVTPLGDGLMEALRVRPYRFVFIEFWYVARDCIDLVRYLQPRVVVVVDSVDVAFNRLEAKARLTQADEDIKTAAEVRKNELQVYEKADLVIVVTKEDALILSDTSKYIHTFIIPNIHPTHAPRNAEHVLEKQMVFIGSFSHEPNVDAMLFFCREVLGLVLEQEPNARLWIIGNKPPTEIQELANEQVEILGYVPDTKPYLEKAAVSIAPLRFGGGMKGKIGEAMSYGLPVVTTQVGVEGFGLEIGTDVLVANTPQDFAKAVVRLIRDRKYASMVGKSGFDFINSTYSYDAIERRCEKLVELIGKAEPRKLPPMLRLRMFFKAIYERNIAWRFT